MDVFISGRYGVIGQETSRLYENDGTGNFTEVTGLPFEAVVESSIGFADVDGDGDPDLIITGHDTNDLHHGRLYINETPIVNSTQTVEPLSIEVYPNPFMDYLFIESNLNGQAELKITDLLGQTVFRQILNTTGQIRIDDIDIDEGLYILSIEQGTTILTSSSIVKIL